MSDDNTQSAAHEDRRPDAWLLELGLEIETGGRPWLWPLLGAPMILAPIYLLRSGASSEGSSAAKDPELPALVDQVSSVATVVGYVAAGLCLVGGIAYWILCRHAHALWLALPQEERDAMVRDRIDGLRRVITALGGEDPTQLPIRAAELEKLNDRHRGLLKDLQGRSKQASTPACSGARGRTDDLVMAGLLYRALSNDTVVRPPHAANAVTDPRVVALAELDEGIRAEAAALGECVDSGRCNCNEVTHDRLVRAGDRAHALLHGLDPADAEQAAQAAGVAPGPRWIPAFTWAGVVVSIAAFPLGLLTPVPVVVISAIGLTLAGVGLFGQARHTTVDPVRIRLLFIVWVAVVVAAVIAVLT